MTPTEIAANLLAQTTLTEETMEPLLAYRREKRATGAPVDLEHAVYYAGRECEEARESLRQYVARAEAEAAKRLVSLDAYGVRFSDPDWFYLDGRQNAEAMTRRLVIAQKHFVALVEAWAAVADRIVATDEDRARVDTEKRDRAIASLATRPVRELRALAKSRGLAAGTDRREIATALVDAGVTAEVCT